MVWSSVEPKQVLDDQAGRLSWLIFFRWRLIDVGKGHMHQLQNPIRTDTDSFPLPEDARGAKSRLLLTL